MDVQAIVWKLKNNISVLMENVNFVEEVHSIQEKLVMMATEKMVMDVIVNAN